MRIIYFDICAIPLFLMILFICYTRKMIRGNANLLFLVMTLVSLFATIADLGMEAPHANLPLSETSYVIVVISSYIYFILRNSTNVILLLFLLHLTRTSFLIQKTWSKIVFSLPYLSILVMLALNPFNHASFTVTRQNGYARGPLMMVFYIIALIYGLIGFVYSIYCRRYLRGTKWIALISIYILGYLAVLIQFLYPGTLVEMFCTAIGEMMIMLTVMRPEERMDSEVGVLSWASYQSDISNIIRSGEHVLISVIQMANSKEIRNYLGDHKYNEYVSDIAEAIRTIHWDRHHRTELYFEKPGTLYMIMNTEDDADEVVKRLLIETNKKIKHYSDTGVRFEPMICLIRVPEDLNNADDVISLGHKFYLINSHKQTIYHASDIIYSQNFAIEAHIEDIIDKAIKDGNVKMYYQPIYDVHTGTFHSAEALARIIDPEYGLISPGIFIPAAEAQGLIIPLGDVVMEEVFRFISQNDLEALGLSYIEINLSVAQCMENNLPEKVKALQEKYKIHPEQVNLEITETVFENISEIMMENVKELTRMGYSFALDDYGIGYSSIQRVNHLPLQLIKIDKSMLDEADHENGRIILESTVKMMQNIGKNLVVEGAETFEMVETLKRMSTDYIQGFYFSKPLPEEDFVNFLKANLKQ